MTCRSRRRGMDGCIQGKFSTAMRLAGRRGRLGQLRIASRLLVFLSEASSREAPNKLPPIISAQGLSKRYGVDPLFRDISFTVSEGDRMDYWAERVWEIDTAGD